MTTWVVRFPGVYLEGIALVKAVTRPSAIRKLRTHLTRPSLTEVADEKFKVTPLADEPVVVPATEIIDVALEQSKARA